MSLPVHVHSLPSLPPAGALRGGVAVVIDVLRATTVMVHAVAAGAREIRPCLEVEEAFDLARKLGQDALLAGERAGLPIEGFHFGNSPSSFTAESCGGRTIVMTTTNGTKALLAATEADRLYASSFVNRTATADRIREVADGRPIHIVCAGTDGRISLEDSVCAGALVACLAGFAEPANDEGRLMGRLWTGSRIDEASGVEREERLLELLRIGRGGRRVTEIGLAADLRDACRIDRFGRVVELLRKPARLVGTGSDEIQAGSG